ncbi:MAG: hypothetical protein HY300_19895 [Verrucomicrobia bacterium]|nr:hypothetical protein [Verrucomicrobiota bacterium]
MQQQPNFDLGLNFGQLIGSAALWVFAGFAVAMLAACLLHWIGHALGLFQLKRIEEPRKFLWSVALMGVFFSCIVGGWTGLKVGVVRAGGEAMTTAGPKLLQSGLEQGLRSAGVTNFTAIEVKRLGELLDEAAKAELPPMEFPGADKWRPQVEEFRRKAIGQARAFLDANEKRETLSLTDLVNDLFPRLSGELATWTQNFTRREIKSGLIWVAGIEGFLALMCLIVRCTSAKPKADAAPPKLAA